MKVVLSLFVSFFIMTSAYATKFTQKEYDEMVSVYLMLLENRQAQLDAAIDQDLPPEVVIDKACLYSGTWKGLFDISRDNLQLEGAKNVMNKASAEFNGFHEFFSVLDTSYDERCKK